VTVAGEQNGANYSTSHYSYDDQGRVSRFESTCDVPSSPCTWTDGLYEFSHADAGWLQMVVHTNPKYPDYRNQYTYNESGQLTELSGATGHSNYSYREDGQLEVSQLFDDYNGDLILSETTTYDYGDDDLLDRVERVGPYTAETDTYSYVIEDGQVRVRGVHFGFSEWDSATIYDDFERPFFKLSEGWVDGDEGLFPGRSVTGYAGGEWSVSWSHLKRNDDDASVVSHSVEVPERMFPYEPLDLSEADVADFSYAYSSYDFTRQARFADDGSLEHLSFSWQFPGGAHHTCEFDVLRCGGVVVETTQIDEQLFNDDVKIYYYGCDDFVLPELPELAH